MFISEVDKVSQSDLEAIKTALNFDSNEELAEKVIIVIDNLNDTDKSKYIAQALHLYSQVELTKSDFLKSIDVIQKIFLGDLEAFAFAHSHFSDNDELERTNTTGLIGTGLIQIQNTDYDELVRDERLNEIGKITYEHTAFGRTFHSVMNNRPPYSELHKQHLIETNKLTRFQI